MNVCRTCGQDFASVRGFDAHRVGRHAYTEAEGLDLRPPRTDGRRCLNSDEMEAIGWVRDRWGRWVHAEALRNRPKKGSYSRRDGRKRVPVTHGRTKSQKNDRHEVEASSP
jgi:hypothetical protein